MAVEGHIFVDGCDRGDRIADEADLVDAESVFVLADRKYAVWNRQIFARDDGNNPGQREGF